jgi:hypothetical protein
VIGVEEIHFGALHGGNLFWIGGRGIVRANAQLRAHLGNQPALAVDLELQFLGIEGDERLALFDRVAHVGQNFGHAALHL